MVAALDSERQPDIRELIRQSRWAEAAESCRQALTWNRNPDPELRLACAIAYLRGGSKDRGIMLLTPEALENPDARLQLRRHVVSAFIKEGDHATAAEVLGRLVAADPNAVDDLRSAASVYGRLKRRDEALNYARRLISLRPDDLPGHTSVLQLLLQSGRAAEAGDHARTIKDFAFRHSKLAAMILLALSRSGARGEAAELASQFDESMIDDEQVAAAVTRALFEVGRSEQAVRTGEQLIADGLDSPQLRALIGQAYLQTSRPNRFERAVEYLAASLELKPDDPNASSAIGEALLRLRRYRDAIPYLAKACEMQPKVPQTRALYARALKQAGQFDEAARQFRQLLDLEPSSRNWQRYAAGALAQAGERRIASSLFESFVKSRRANLPRKFEDGLEALWAKVDEVELPKARLDWAFKFSGLTAQDREEWERRAKWGHLADHYLLDWLECRDDLVHEAMGRLADLNEAERILAPVDRTNGVLLASAHIGPMYSGPLALELLGIEARWLASTPSVARTAYAKSLISTSDQDDLQVARAVMSSLKQGCAVVIAIDGAINLGAPRIPFEGQEITYSSFVARTAFKLGIASFFCAPRWEGDRIGFILRRMPDPYDGEGAENHADRWRQAYLASLKEYLGGSAENLRLSGGLWRHIR